MIRLICAALLACAVAFATGAGATTKRVNLLAEFEQARQERAAGQYDQAIPRLRAILRVLPDDAGVREELGYVLLLDNQYAAAQYHFQILAERAPDAAKRELYRAVLRRILNERPVGVRLIFSIVPSSNVNSGSDNNVIDTGLGVLPISDGSQAQSGWRATYGLSGYLRRGIGPRDRVSLNWAVSDTRYDTSLVDDVRQIDLSLSWEHLRPRGGVFASLGGSELDSDSETLTREIATLGGFRLSGPRGRIDWSVTRTQHRYAVERTKSGPELVGVLRYTWFLPRGQSVWAGIRLEDFDPERAHQRYDGKVLQVGGRKLFRSGLAMDATLSIGVRDFTGVFPGVSFARDDEFHELSLSFQDSRITWRGFSPRATCRARWNRSNIALFDATTHECALELSRRF